MRKIFAIAGLVASSALGLVIVCLADHRASPAIALIAFATVPGVTQSARAVAMPTTAA